MHPLKTRQYCLTLVLVGLAAVYARAQPSLFDSLYRCPEPPTLVLDTDWRALQRNKQLKQYQPATVTVVVAGDSLRLAGKVRTRGNVRLQVCQYPSLKIKIKRAALRAAGFSELNDLKLVLQCNSSSVGEAYNQRERMVYGLHAIYSDYHHRTVALRLVAPAAGLQLESFAVEAEEQLATRYDARVLASDRASTRGLERAHYVNMCLFNYLILNTDWHVFNLHNVEFISPTGTTDLIAIPYDFDYAGFVGTHYAIPREDLRIASVYVARWLGKRVTADEIRQAAAHFRDREAAALNYLSTHPALTKQVRRRVLRRFAEFSALLRDEAALLRLIE